MASVLDMSNILEKMSLGYISQRFIDENITPDIVCMLSLFELNQLGLRNRSEIMALRIECTKYSGGQPLKNQDVNGHLKYEIPQEILESFLDEGFLISEIATMLSVSESTIYRRMRCYGLNKLTFSDVTEEQLDAHVSEIAKDFPFCGEKMFKHILEQKGIRVQRMRLRDSIHRVDDELRCCKQEEGTIASSSLQCQGAQPSVARRHQSQADTVEFRDCGRNRWT